VHTHFLEKPCRLRCVVRVFPLFQVLQFPLNAVWPALSLRPSLQCFTPTGEPYRRIIRNSCGQLWTAFPVDASGDLMQTLINLV
jgi:hypothetical protein